MSSEERSTSLSELSRNYILCNYQFSYSFDQFDHNAVVPTSGANGTGVVVGPKTAVQLRIDSTYQSGNLYVSAAGVSGTGSVYVTPGVL